MAYFRMRRSQRRKYLNTTLTILLVLTFFDFWSLVWQHSRRHANVPAFSQPKPSESLSRPERIFITSTHWNNEIVLRESWNAAVVQLAEYLGPENVFVSIVESGSWDNTKGALRELQQSLDELKTPSKIVLEEITHAEAITQPPAPSGWIDTPRGRKELRRIPYLSNIRNRALEPMFQSEEKFDKILFLNDVVFTIDDIRTLLATRNGEYAAACSLDFKFPPKYYDTFALRDTNGDPTVTQYFPFFRSSASRNAMMAMEPVPVQSCWNGIAVFNAVPFYVHQDGRDLRFRGIPDSLAKYHLEGSECCLIHADNPLTETLGVWLNPNVRVGYNKGAYDAVHSSSDGSWLSISEYISGVWSNRLRRWTTSTWLNDWTVSRRVNHWRRGEKSNVEPGQYCLISEMQVLVENGWKHL